MLAYVANARTSAAVRPMRLMAASPGAVRPGAVGYPVLVTGVVAQCPAVVVARVVAQLPAALECLAQRARAVRIPAGLVVVLLALPLLAGLCFLLALPLGLAPREVR